MYWWSRSMSVVIKISRLTPAVSQPSKGWSLDLHYDDFFNSVLRPTFSDV